MGNELLKPIAETQIGQGRRDVEIAMEAAVGEGALREFEHGLSADRFAQGGIGVKYRLEVLT
ncbi:MAG: hypothetical protein A2X72_04810 [Burkholderiales bacterium GWF1_66_17]|nr:MAG: hypothetical protein A2X73_19905 [Burkholderiales bacterium GWE1_65_30]OGA91484.1 MAG: hypothetical protein A2X72_04810 [Burkholderiales bacterium GWF1_66_17]